MTAQRRSLAVGLSKIEDADPRAVEAFIKQESAPAEKPARTVLAEVKEPSPEGRLPAEQGDGRRSARPIRRGRPTPLLPVGLIPVTVRLRPEVASALKRASLERQLAGIEIHTQQQLVEEALLPWLMAEGVLD